MPPRQSSQRDTAVLAVRMKNELYDQVMEACGGKKALPEWLRNMLRRTLGIPLDRTAGYAEGFSAGWADANAKFHAVLDKSKGR